MDSPFYTGNPFGMQIVPYPLAIEHYTEFVVIFTSHRRRKRYQVYALHRTRPACWRIGETLLMHPALIEHMNKSISDKT